MDWNLPKAMEAENILRKWRGLTKTIPSVSIPDEVVQILSDDLNTAGVFL